MIGMQSRSVSKDDTPVRHVDLSLSVVKPLGAEWMSGLYDDLKAKPKIIPGSQWIQRSWNCRLPCQ